MKNYKNYKNDFIIQNGGTIKDDEIVFYSKGIYYTNKIFSNDKEIYDKICSYNIINYNDIINTFLSESNVFYFWTIFTYKSRITNQNKKPKIKKFPKPKINNDIINYFETLHSYIDYLKRNDTIHEFVENNHIIININKLINNIITELYFTDILNNNNIYFIRDKVEINKLDGINDNDYILDFFKKRKEPDNLTRNYEMLIYIHCNTILPILTIEKF